MKKRSFITFMRSGRLIKVHVEGSLAILATIVCFIILTYVASAFH